MRWAGGHGEVGQLLLTDFNEVFPGGGQGLGL